MRELYTLDALYRRQQVIDRYQSLIWTERYAEYGDFEFHAYPTARLRGLLKLDTKIAMNDSYRVMVVETVEDDVDDDGKKVLIVKGRSLETIMENRVAKESLTNLTDSPTWTITGTPGGIMRKIFHDICVTGILNVGDKIPFILEAGFLPSGSIDEPDDPVTVDIEPTTVYDALTNLAKVWTLGFRLLRQDDTSQLYFDVYSGSDRTTGQTVNDPIVFSSDLNNLANTKQLLSMENAKNVAYVFSPVGFQMVYAIGVDPEIEGFERRVLVVNASDITSETADPVTAMIQRGNDELAKTRVTQTLDGEITQYSQYRYGQAYELGDIVELRDDTGGVNNMRVTEQIFVSDAEGERTYPTLVVNTFINTGSWLSWQANKKWVEMGPTEYWNTQP